MPVVGAGVGIGSGELGSGVGFVGSGCVGSGAGCVGSGAVGSGEVGVGSGAGSSFSGITLSPTLKGSWSEERKALSSHRFLML